MQRLVMAVALAVLVGIIYFGWLFGSNPDRPIPTTAEQVPGFLGKAASARPVNAAPLPQHPWLAAQGINSMHNDSYQSDAYQWAGPLGHMPVVRSQQFHRVVGSCVAATWTAQSTMIQTCVTPFGVTLIARDPNTLKILTRKKITRWLPVGQKFSGGVYFHLDHEDRVLLASNDPEIQLWQLAEENPDWQWEKQQAIDLGPALNALQQTDHAVIDVMPDWEGNYWFITRRGLVGVSNRDGSAIDVIALAGEGIDNAMAVGRNGVFVVSDHAMYRFTRTAAGRVNTAWRENYDRGSAPKPGTMGHGSGTTPTLMGDDYVAITDNADGQINVMVYRQQGPDEQRTACRQPVFPADRGTSENSLSAAGNSLIVENNFGYQGPYENITAEPGLVRVDVNDGGQGCEVVWENLAISSPSAVPKLSLANGLIYLYTRDPANDPALQAWYFTAVDFHSGELAFKVLTGIGPGYNNHYGSMSLSENGEMYLGVLQGLVSVRDGAVADGAAQQGLR